MYKTLVYMLKGHGPDYAHAPGTPPATLTNHLCGFQLSSSSCFMAYPLDETVSTAIQIMQIKSIQDVCQVVCRHFWVTCMHMEVLL